MTRTPTPTALHLVALLAPPAVAGLLSLVRDGVSAPNAALLLVLVVVAVAAAGRRGPGLLSAVSSAVSFDFFLTEPYLRLTIEDRADVETAVLLVLVGLAVSELALWGRRQQGGSSQREGYLQGLVSAAGMAAAGEVPTASVVTFVGEQIAEVLGVDRCDFRRGGPSGSPQLHGDGSVTRNGSPVAVDRSGLPSQDVVEIPVSSGGAVLGCFVVQSTRHVVWPTAEQRRVAASLADQAGAALAAEHHGSGRPDQGSRM